MSRPVLLLALVGCANPATDPGCANGLDLDADGVCDRDRADFSADASIPEGTDRADIYGLGDDLPSVRERGLEHVFVWPVEVSGLLLPYRPLASFLSEDSSNPALQSLARNALGFGTMPEMYDWLGLAPYQADASGIYAHPIPAGFADGDKMGASVIDTQWGEALTFSCATCHATSFFGRTVVGLTNREARANEFFHLATLFFPAIDPTMFGEVTSATEAELDLFVRTQTNLPAVGAKVPEVAGLDTALAQVGLSLVRRADDGWATRDRDLELTPEPTDLDTFVADSKPAVWWTLKRKTRWLSDGSIVSGNPIFTNFLWNELGRATDLVELDAWFGENGTVVDELTAAVFATEAPRWTDFFPASTLDVDAARRGEVLYGEHCASCHGTYEKDWDDPTDPFATVSVRYAEQTRPVDVGTDPQRAQGMSRFADGLNGLELSGTFDTVVEVQQGYVPPPLDGIWARFPYLHHEAVPTLCDLLRPAELRPVEFWVGPTDDPETDFDPACVGYPTGEAVPEAWKAERRRHYDTRLVGLGNQGHDAWLVDVDGVEILSAADRADLVMFLKTL